jgi:hypothetical protein
MSFEPYYYILNYVTTLPERAREIYGIPIEVMQCAEFALDTATLEWRRYNVNEYTVRCPDNFYQNNSSVERLKDAYDVIQKYSNLRADNSGIVNINGDYLDAFKCNYMNEPVKFSSRSGDVNVIRKNDDDEINKRLIKNEKYSRGVRYAFYRKRKQLNNKVT